METNSFDPLKVESYMRPLLENMFISTSTTRIDLSYDRSTIDRPTIYISPYDEHHWVEGTTVLRRSHGYGLLHIKSKVVVWRSRAFLQLFIELTFGRSVYGTLHVINETFNVPISTKFFKNVLRKSHELFFIYFGTSLVWVRWYKSKVSLIKTLYRKPGLKKGIASKMSTL